MTFICDRDFQLQYKLQGFEKKRKKRAKQKILNKLIKEIIKLY